jgi:hypothetical protein
MTKVEMSFQLRSPLTETQMQRLSDTHRLYGIFTTRLDPSLESLMVEYDASRLTPQDVEAALAHQGLPVDRRV